MAEQKPDFPLTNMPRMGRRNAIAPNDLEGSEFGGAFSPLNLLQRTSLADEFKRSDAQKTLTKQHLENVVKMEGIEKIEEKSEKLPSIVPLEPKPIPPSQDFPDSWKRIADTVTKMEAMLDPKTNAKFKERLDEIPVPSENHTVVPDESHKTGPVIPWKKHDEHLTTIGEERRKIFESFNKTSFEPPETPHVSESKIRKLMNKAKRNKMRESVKQSDSEESLDLPVTPNSSNKPQRKDPYANIMPKVNTRWDKYDETNKFNLQNQEKEHIKVAKKAADIIGKAVGASTKQSKKTSKIISKTKTSTAKKSGPTLKVATKKGTAIILKPKTANKAAVSKKDSKTTVAPANNRLITSFFPTTEKVKETVAKLPLTIGPRYNARKAMGMANTNGVQNKAELEGQATTRLYGSINPYQKLKFDDHAQQQQPAQGGNTGASYKSTFFNLHRINTGGGGKIKKANETIGDLVVVRRAIPGGVGNIISVEKKKPGPPLTTIQAPPSPFMQSNISIPSQLNEIPVNGEVRIAILPAKSTSSPLTNKAVKKGTVKRENATGNKNAASNNKAQPQRPTISSNNKAAQLQRPTVASNNKSLQPKPNVVVTNRNANKNTNVAGKPAHPLRTQFKPKNQKVPTMGAAANKYNNIYIGPYSGSESEGELPNPKLNAENSQV